eukprot:14600707-Ditylum_brightwellii.AAC.1
MIRSPISVGDESSLESKDTRVLSNGKMSAAFGRESMLPISHAIAFSSDFSALLLFLLSEHGT